jgi:hypothetical protein
MGIEGVTNEIAETGIHESQHVAASRQAAATIPVPTPTAAIPMTTATATTAPTNGAHHLSVVPHMA